MGKNFKDNFFGFIESSIKGKDLYLGTYIFNCVKLFTQQV